MSLDYQQGGVEVGVATKRMHQEVVSVQEALAGEVVKIMVNVSITNREEMDIIGPVPARRGDFQGTSCQEMARIKQSQHKTFLVQISQL